MNSISYKIIKQALSTPQNSHIFGEFREKAVTVLLDSTGIRDLTPDVYKDYRPVVLDGIRFVLLSLSNRRFRELVEDQLRLPHNASPGERLMQLALNIPMLHKLGQIIARNKNIDIEFRKWLIHLENGIKGTDIESLKLIIDKELSDVIFRSGISIGNTLISEASVAAVLPFTFNDTVAGETGNGVLKIIKPYIPVFINEELNILDELALFFDKNRERYFLKDFRFLETIGDIKYALEREINLKVEQANLKNACSFYKADSHVKIPASYDFSTTNITAMEFIPGEKITDFPLTDKEKRLCAEIVFRTMFCHPLFSTEDSTLFHGDPHSGNIFAFRKDNENIGVAFIDWSLAGVLSIEQRRRIISMIHGLLCDDKEGIFRAIDMLVQNDFKRDSIFKFTVMEEIERLPWNCGDNRLLIINRALCLLDRLAVRGVKFPRDLLLYRKALFTVKGVIQEVYPPFDMEAYMMKYLVDLITKEMPLRSMYMFSPQMDRPYNYKSLMSNTDLFLLINNLFTTFAYSRFTLTRPGHKQKNSLKQ